MSVNAYELIEQGDLWDETAYNQVTAALGRITDTSLNPRQPYDFVVWRVGAVYYARNGSTGQVTSNAACHSLVNGLLATNKSFFFVGDTTYVLSGAIDLASYSSITIAGNPRRGTVFQPADTINAFELDESWWCVFKDFRIDGSNQSTSGMGVKFTEATATNYAKHNRFQDLEFTDCYIGIGDTGGGSNGALDNRFQDLSFTDCTFADIKLNINGTGFWRFHRIDIDHVATQASDTYCFNITGPDGLEVNNLTILTGGASSKGAVQIKNTDFIKLDNIDIEKAGYSIIYLENCTFAQLSNIRLSEGGMAGAASGEANLKILGGRDINVNNFVIGTTTGATNIPVKVGKITATESDRVNFVNGRISGGAGVGLHVYDGSTYVKVLNTTFLSNSDDDVKEEGTTDYNTYKNCSFESGVGWTLIGEHNSYDQMVQARSVLDLSGGATDEDIFYANVPCVLAGYRIYYTEASSADVDWAVDAVRIGRYQDGVALDDDYFDETVTEASKNLGYSKYFNTAALTNHVIAAEDTVTVGTGGGKTGAGTIRVVLNIIEQAS